MVSFDINLIRQSTLFSPKWKKIYSITRNSAYTVLVVFIVVAIAVFSGKYFVRSKIRQVSEAAERAKGQIEKSKATEGIFLSLGQKLNVLGEITNSRLDAAKHYTVFSQIISKYGRVVQVTISTGQTLIKGEIDNPYKIDTLISELLNNGKIPVKQVMLLGFDRAESFYTAEFVILY